MKQLQVDLKLFLNNLVEICFQFFETHPVNFRETTEFNFLSAEHVMKMLHSDLQVEGLHSAGPVKNAQE